MCLTSLSERQLAADLFNSLFRLWHRANQNHVLFIQGHVRVFFNGFLLLWLIYLFIESFVWNFLFLFYWLIIKIVKIAARGCRVLISSHKCFVLVYSIVGSVSIVLTIVWFKVMSNIFWFREFMDSQKFKYVQQIVFEDQWMVFIFL